MSEAKDPVPAVIKAIQVCLDNAKRNLKKAADYEVTAGQRMLELYTRHKAGEFGQGFSWGRWAEVYVKLKKTRIYELLSIGRGEKTSDDRHRLECRLHGG